jgi:hypothetical protein
VVLICFCGNQLCQCDLDSESVVFLKELDVESRRVLTDRQIGISESKLTNRTIACRLSDVQTKCVLMKVPHSVYVAPLIKTDEGD